MHTFVYFVIFSTLWFGVGIFTSIYFIRRIYKMFGSITNAIKALSDEKDIEEDGILEEVLKFVFMIMITLFWPAYILAVIEKSS